MTTGSTTERGYGTEHQRERRRLIPIVRREGAQCQADVCLMPSRFMPPGTQPREWDLGHTLARTAWTGPEHRKCNRTEPQLRTPTPTREDAPVIRRWEL